MTSAITFDLLARDHASAAVRKVGDELETLNGRTARFAKGFAASLGIAFGAEKLAEFGKSAVNAFAAAQTAEARLENAFQRFPKLADTNIAAMRAMNDQIERRTGFLSRDLAAGEANLAQFNLTGTQLKQITPLLVDYADKTGIAIPEAATMLGRALLGNQRALKSIGISMPTVTASAKELAKAQHEVESTSTSLKGAQDRLTLSIAEMRDKRKVTAADEIRYKDAQNAVRDAYAKNQAALAGLRAEQDRTAKSGSYFDQVVTALRGKVGGFANQESQTAQGQLRKLSAEFDRVKVEVGAKLLPVALSFGHFLTGTLVPDLEHLAGWLKRNSDVIVPLAKFVGGLTIAIYATNKATALWATTSKAAAAWTRLLGISAATAAPEVVAEGGAATEAAAANSALAASAEAAAGGMAAAGASAVANVPKLLGFLSLAGKVARFGSLLDPMMLPVLFAGNGNPPKNVTDAEGQLQSLIKQNFSLSGSQVLLGGSLVTNSKVADAVKAMLLPNADSTGLYKNYLTSDLAPSDKQILAELGLIQGALGSGRQPSVNNATGGSDLPNKLRQTLQAPSKTATHSANSIRNILAGLPQFAVGSGGGIASGIAQGIKQKEGVALAAAKSLASKIKGQIDSIRSTMSQYVTGIAGTITGNAGLLNTGNQTVAGIINFQKHQLSIDQTFHRNLAKLVKLGYSPAYISELAQAGPEQAGNIAAQLTTADVAQRNEINRLGHAIGASAQQTGELAARSYYAKQAHQMDALEKQLKAVNTNIKAITSDLASLQRTGHLQTRVTKK